MFFSSNFLFFSFDRCVTFDFLSDLEDIIMFSV
jgi:hypothetical protein